MVRTPEVNRWLTEVQHYLGAVSQAVERVSNDPVGAGATMDRAAGAALAWLDRDPGPWPDVTELMKTVALSCQEYATVAKTLVARARESAPTNAATLRALSDRIVAELEMLADARRRRGLAG